MRGTTISSLRLWCAVGPCLGAGLTGPALGYALLACAIPGCVTEQQPSSEPPEDVSKFIIDKLPENITPLNVNFDDKIVLAGVEVEPGTSVPAGKRVKLTMYWRVDKALDAPDWKLFTHVIDGSGDRLMNIDNVGPLRHIKRNGQTWPPSSWVPGKIYVDTQTFTMPRKVKGDKVQVTTGIWRGKERLPVRSGSTLSDNRALVVTLETTSAADAKTTRVPRVEVPLLAKGAAMRIDGKLDEAAWATATDTGAFINVSTGEPAPDSKIQGSAKALWDDKWLYLAFDVKDEDVVGGFDQKQTDPHLWTKDCVEIMVDPDGNGDNKDYYEIQINPQNLVFDSQFDEYNKPKTDPDGPFGHQEWSAKLESAVQIKGTLDNSSDKDEGYVVELRIPWKSFDKAKEVPPKPGASWRLNLYAMQNNDGVAWSPILDQGNFHKASRFGRMSWVNELSKPGAKAEPDDSKTRAAATPAPSPAGDAEKGALTVTKKSLQTTPSPVAPSATTAPSAVAPAPVNK
jgi:hypothetical protein